MGKVIPLPLAQFLLDFMKAFKPGRKKENKKELIESVTMEGMVAFLKKGDQEEELGIISVQNVRS
uniref:Uncharacterized protein n=1 Tax=Candidatus Kentrum sp. DK TaxID=2126562 RepID=A0A450TLI2_9GAMM|nr:MAG: hypothetical protein BECKDK2373B_GA0170837_12192 [Candidatus Kentron sp. DK]